MGASFCNFQIYCDDRSAWEVRRAVLAAVNRVAMEQGFRVAPTDEPSERSVAVAPADGSRWIGVYDEQSESQDLQGLSETAERLSDALSLPVVGILVHESDSLFLCLCEGGTTVDRFVNDVNLIEEEALEVQNGTPELWEPMIAAEGVESLRRQLGTDVHAVPQHEAEEILDFLGDLAKVPTDGHAGPEALRQVWDRPTLLAESQLRRFAALLGLEGQRYDTGYSYLNRTRSVTPEFWEHAQAQGYEPWEILRVWEASGPASELEDTPGFSVLRFTSAP